MESTGDLAVSDRLAGVSTGLQSGSCCEQKRQCFSSLCMHADEAEGEEGSGGDDGGGGGEVRGWGGLH